MIKKFLASVLFVSAGVFALDRLGGKVMQWVNQHTHDVSGPKIRYLVEDVREDVVLMGTSRCNFHYVPSIISDSIGMSVYNGGIGGSDNIYAHYIALCYILAHHTPKIVCLDVATNDFAVQDDPLRTISFFAPYFGRNAAVDTIFREAGTYDAYRLSHLYRYNAKAVPNLAGLIMSRQEKADHGYVPLARPMHFSEKLGEKEGQKKIDEKKITYVRRFIALCREHGIQLVFSISPSYTIVVPTYYDALKCEAHRYGVPFLDYHSAGLFLDHPEYFRDNSHLWDEGAKLFSEKFAGDFRRTIADIPVH